MIPPLQLIDPDKSFDAIVVEFIAYVAAFYGALEFLNQYAAMRRLRSRFKLDGVELGTLALILAAAVKFATLTVERFS